MTAGARTPDELETLFEDALLIGDSRFVADLFEEGALLITETGESAYGRQDVVQLALATSSGTHTYIADPLDIQQACGLALIVARQSINVVRRSSDGHWRYVIVRLLFESECERETDDTGSSSNAHDPARCCCQ